MSFAPPLDWAPVDARDRGDLSRYSGGGVHLAAGGARRSPTRVAALGGHGRRHRGLGRRGRRPRTALGDALGTCGRPSSATVGGRGAAGALARAMLAAGCGARCCFPAATSAGTSCLRGSGDEGIAVEEVVCYRSVLAGEAEAREAAQRAQMLLVASPSVADLLARACPPGARPALLAVGPTTAAAARASGWPPAGGRRRPTAEALAPPCARSCSLR